MLPLQSPASVREREHERMRFLSPLAAIAYHVQLCPHNSAWTSSQALGQYWPVSCCIKYRKLVSQFLFACFASHILLARSENAA